MHLQDIQPLFQAFQTAMDDDFNTPRALAALFDCATRINQIGNKANEAEKSGGRLGDEDLARVRILADALDELGGEILGIELESPHADIQHLFEGLKTLFSEIRKESEDLGGQIERCLASPGGEAEQEAGAALWIERLIALRAAARKEKQWALADRIRDGLKGLGLELLDRPGGTEWRKTG